MSNYDNVLIRNFQSSDTDQTCDVFFSAVSEGASAFYNDMQRKAWASEKPEPHAWQKRLSSQYAKVAALNGQIVGFMTLTKAGIIDLAFVVPEAMGTGVAKKLYDAVVLEAQNAEMQNIKTEASFLAQHFFKKQGWQTIRQQTIQRQTAKGETVELTNFLMELNLTSDVIKSNKINSAR